MLFVPVDEAGPFDPYGLSRDELVTQGPTAFALLESLREDLDLLNLNPSSSYYYVGIGGFSLSDYDIRCKF